MSEPPVPRIVYVKRWVYEELLLALQNADGVEAGTPYPGDEKIALHGFELLEFRPWPIPQRPLNLKTLPGRRRET